MLSCAKLVLVARKDCSCGYVCGDGNFIVHLTVLTLPAALHPAPYSVIFAGCVSDATSDLRLNYVLVLTSDLYAAHFAEDPDIEHAQSAVHNTFTLEQTLMQMISKGDVGALCEWLSRAPSIRGGVIANDALRQIKNTFIVTATLASRAAINGGLDVESSLSLSDNYIKKCELLSDVKDIFNLQYHMILDYTRKVERVRLGKTPSKLLMQVTNYVQKNLSKPTDVDELSKEMYISRTHLASKFKKETGMTLSDFILKEKTEEAKRLLRYSDKPLCLIGEYLGFSSQSHFNRTFRKYTGKTPGDYRQSNK